MTESSNRMGVHLPLFFIEESKANTMREIADAGPLNISALLRLAGENFLTDYAGGKIDLKRFALIEEAKRKGVRLRKFKDGIKVGKP